MIGKLKRRLARLPRWLHDRSGPLTQQLTLRRSSAVGRLLPARMQAQRTEQLVCGFCSTGCGLDVHMNQGNAVGLTPSTAYPVNLGMACPKGWEALRVLEAPDRAATPLLRNQRERFEAIDWQTAMQVFVERMQAIQHRHGPQSVAFLSTGQITTEEMALLGAVAKFGMGMVHGDGNTRQCMATAVTAYKQAFGFDAPPYSYADFEQSDVIVLVGSNLCIAHPIMWQRVMQNPHRPEIIVVDPRRTETAMQATLHVPVRPKSDLTLFYGLARLLIEHNCIDREFIAAHTSDFDAFEQFIAPYTLERVTKETGLDRDVIEAFAQRIADGRRVSFWWTMGVNQSHQGVRTAQAIINLALMTGNVGKPGTGANSITGQCNAMGSRLFSNTTCLLGGRDFENPHDRQRVATLLGIDEGVIPRQASWPYHRIVEGILRGEIRGLWVIGTNPAHSWINHSQLHDILGRLDFLVVQDMYTTTETAARADLLLPAAAWGEKDGTFINSERRIGVVRKVASAPGAALADFSIFRLIAQAWGCGEMFRNWTSPAAVFELLKQLSAGRPCDFSGIAGLRHLAERGGIQWPFPAGSPPPATERRLFGDGRFYHPDGKARFLFDAPRPLPEAAGPRYPLTLLTGRGSAAQWHTQTRTAKSAVLRKLYPGTLYVEVHPQDARRFGVSHHQWVQVVSQRGRLEARVLVTPTIPPGQVFLPMHDPEVNRLTFPAFDPHSSQPAYKACAVRIEVRG